MRDPDVYTYFREWGEAHALPVFFASCFFLNGDTWLACCLFRCIPVSLVAASQGLIVGGFEPFAKPIFDSKSPSVWQFIMKNGL